MIRNKGVAEGLTEILTMRHLPSLSPSSSPAVSPNPSAPSIPPAAMPADLLVGAARCWRKARDQGRPVQPCLFGLLSPQDCGMLAPVLDSVMTLWEASLGRHLTVGQRDRLSEDERLLLELFDGTRTPAPRPDSDAAMARSFDCALCSARIMMKRVMAPNRAATGTA